MGYYECIPYHGRHFYIGINHILSKLLLAQVYKKRTFKTHKVCTVLTKTDII